MALSYLHYDVFTSEPLLGNQLAVFPDGRGLTAERMQKIAREINFAETTFIFPAERADTDIRMRIFTPAVEMPMAGHPTVGSTFALAQIGRIRPQTMRFVFGLNIGPTPVDLIWDDDRLRFVWMTQGVPVFGPVIEDRTAAARAIGLHSDDLLPGVPVQEVSCGVPYVIVALRDHEAVDRAAPDAAAMRALGSLRPRHAAVFLFAPSGTETAEVYSRMFAPDLGVVEDPATGSASGPLGCYLVQHGLVSAQAAQRIVSTQGVKMGRASRVHVAIAGGRDSITGVRVGGEAVLVARGEFLA